jgi:opacity protein-like surface antigen
MAENCTLPPAANVSFSGAGNSASAISSMIGGTIAAANTAFALQSTAFVGSPPNPQPGQQGGGVWVRGVDGNVNIKSTSNSALASTAAPAPSAAINCSQQVDVNFGGFQLGADISKLNWDGWNLHSGVTAGDLGTKGVLVGGFPSFLPVGSVGAGTVGGGEMVSGTHVPFIGIYGVATNGGFAIDALLREAYYQTNIDGPISNIFNQSIDAHGLSFSSSVTYQWQVPNSNWFIEPSAGVIISRTKVDPLNFVTAGYSPTFDSYSSTLRLSDVKSDIGRVGLRFGDSIESGNVIWQPFGAFSVWHEFGPNIASTFSTAPGTAFALPIPPGTPTTLSGTTSTSTFGTYEQYSVGISAAVVGTGWLEFLRADYRDGPNLQGWSGSGGIRYQFTPDPPSKGALALKAKAPPAVVTAVNWTGFYVGGFGGATQGDADWGYAVGEVSPYIAGYLFGGNVGYNYQSGPYVVGVEADLARTNTRGGIACGSNSASGALGALALSPMFQQTCNAWANWVATAAARIGYTWDRSLWYVKAGGAWADEQFSATCNFGVFNYTTPGGQHCTNPAGGFSNGFQASTDHTGWVVGYGNEFALTQNWSAKAEADYISFGDRNVVASDGSALKVGMHLWEEKIGVNYRF